MKYSFRKCEMFADANVGKFHIRLASNILPAIAPSLLLLSVAFLLGV